MINHSLIKATLLHMNTANNQILCFKVVKTILKNILEDDYVDFYNEQKYSLHAYRGKDQKQQRLM